MERCPNGKGLVSKINGILLSGFESQSLCQHIKGLSASILRLG